MQETIPVDGAIVEGEAYVNEASSTGEGFCVARRPGDTVRAGTRTLDGTLVVRASTAGQRSQLDDLREQVLAGLGARSKLQTRVERVARWFFPGVSLVAVATFAAWLHVDVTKAFLHAMAVLLVACPCALGFATPMGFWTSVVRLARLGILTRDTAAIERLGGVDTMLFDKTGTLTHVQLSAKGIVLMPGTDWSESEVMAMSRAAQTLSDHPIAVAFASLSPSGPRAVCRPHALRLLPGCGIEVDIDSPRGPLCLRMGDPQRLAHPADAPALARIVASRPAHVRSVGLFVRDRAVAVFDMVEDPVSDRDAMLHELGRLDVTCSICSGDRMARLGEWHAFHPTGDMSPDDKVARVRTLRDEGRRVCFVGDGVNDAAAMAMSDTSVAISTGSPLALQTADFTMRQAALANLPAALAVARQTLRVVRTNLWLATGYNAIGITVAAAGFLHPVFAAVLMLCSSVTVTLRSAALLDGPARP